MNKRDTQQNAAFGMPGRVARYFLQSSLTPLLALIALLLGVFAMAVTPREEEPQINVTLANVLVAFPGASAREVENLVSIPAEQVLSRVAGVEHVYSVSRPGQAIITVQYAVGVDPDHALLNLYDTVHSRRDWLSPQLGTAEPIIKPMGIDDVPVLAVTLWTKDPERGAYALERVAHALEIELKRIPGAREVATLGGPGHLIRVLLDPDRLAAFGLTAQEVKRALQSANASRSSGSVVRDNREILIQSGEFLADGEDVRGLMIGVHEGRPVMMSDVAHVVEGPDLPGRYVWFGQGGKNAAQETFPAVTLTVTKKPGENAVDLSQAVKKRLALLHGTVIPEGVEVTVTRDYGETADEKARTLMGKLAFATGSVVLLVLFALGRREAVVVGTAVVLTLAATLFASWAWGFTLNRVSLFALIFSIGILVDDAIVVVENIHRRRTLEPNRAFAEVIPEAVDEVGRPTVLATFTVIAALMPMAFVSGLMGPYMSPIPINASFGMVISLAIAFVVTPWLSYKLLKRHAHAGEAAPGKQRIARLFERLMTPFLHREQGRRHRRLIGLGVALLIVFSLSLAGLTWVVLKMLPFDNKSEFQVVVDMPEGTPLEKTAAVLREMGDALSRVPEVANYQAYAGTASPINFNGLVRQYFLRSSPELGDIQVNLVEKHARSRQSHVIATSVREALQTIASRHGAALKVVEVPPGPPVLSPIVAEVYGPDLAGQRRVARQVRAAFERTADIVFVDDSVQEAAEKRVLRVQQAKAMRMGVSQQDIVETIAMAVGGEYVTPAHLPDAKYEVPVRISLPPERLGTLEDALKLRVRAADGALVPVSELVTEVVVPRDPVIHHKDLLPVVTVVGDMAGGLDSPLYGMFRIREAINGMALPEGGTLGEHFISQPEDPYAGYSIKWDGEWQITYETFRDMGIAYAVGLVLIYLLVVAEFRSYVTPLVIMAPIPLTLIGVMPGHALLGAQFTATSMIGMIALAGIIVRNSILLVDFIEQQVAAGVEFQQAVIQAAVVRAQPIVLTGLAAMLGAFFILDDPIFNGLAISLIFGILVSTLLTLWVIPVLYYAFNYSRHEGDSHDHQPHRA